MPVDLRVLIVEDDRDDAELLLRELRAGDINPDWTLAASEQDYLAALDRPFDVILSDFRMPGFDALDALKQLRERGLDTPFIIVSGAIGEEVAVEAMKQGAADYVSKDRLARVGSAALRAVEHHRVCREAAQCEELYRRIVTTALEGIWTIDSDGRTDYVNDRMAKMLGYTASDMLGHPPEDFVHEADIDQLRRIADAHRQGVGGHLDFRFRRKDGTDLWARLAVTPHLDEAKRFVGALAMVMDVTDRRRAEQALREGEERYRVLFNRSPVAIGIGRSGGVRYVNPACVQMFGEGADSGMIGKLWLDFLAPEYREEAQLALDAAVAKGAKTAALETTGLRADGSQFPLAALVSAVDLPDGAAIMLFFTDLTDRRRAEEAQRFAAIGQLGAGVAHEFNNLLAAMSGRAQLAEALGTWDAYGQLADTVNRATARGAEITGKLLTFARPAQPRRQGVAIEQPIEAALGLAAREITNAQIAVVKQYQTLGRLVYADPGQIQQVLLNLIINACHAMPGGGSLTITTRYVPEVDFGMIVVTVEDTGVGIPPDLLSRIFEPFYTTKGRLGESHQAGTGLGLAVSQGIIAAHGGTITAHSRPGMGTRFELRLAAAQGGTTAADPEPQKLELQPCRSRKGAILVADDEGDLREILVTALTRNGYEVIAAADTDEALRALSQRSFGLVISDLLMPGGGGRALLKAARELADSPPVVIVTGREEDHILDELRAAGAAHCLRKPVMLPDLLAMVKNMVASGGD